MSQKVVSTKLSDLSNNKLNKESSTEYNSDTFSIDNQFIQVVDGNLHSEENYKATDFIPCVNATRISVCANFNNRYVAAIAFYDTKKTYISSISNTGSAVNDNEVKEIGSSSIPSNAAYIRASSVNNQYNTKMQPYIHIYYGIKEAIDKKFDKASVVQEIGEAEDKVMSQKAVSDKLKELEGISYPKIILPNKLFIKSDRTFNLYWNQFVQNYNVSDSIALTSYNKFRTFENVLNHAANSDTSEENNTISVHRSSIQKNSMKLDVISVTSPETQKRITILNIGDSISDLGRYQFYLTKLLESDNIIPNWIGLMSHITSYSQVGAPSSETINSEICNEVLSGGKQNFVTTAIGPSALLTVSGISELPVTRYPGTQYRDSNGSSWVVRGYKFDKDSNGKYYGILKLGKFTSDPNYGDGTSSDTSQDEWNAGTEGVINKIPSQNGATLAGDSTISYTNYEKAYFNPFWNPQNKELDFNWYINKWGFDAPDVLLMAWGYNDIYGLYSEENSSDVSTAVSKAIKIIDKFHSDFPNAKIIYGLNPWGTESPTFNGFNRNVIGKKYSMLSFVSLMKKTFEKDKYKDFVYLIPIYSLLDSVNGYGNLVEKQITDFYGNVKKTVLQNGLDGVHPPYLGCKEIGNSYEAVLCNIAKEL